MRDHRTDAALNRPKRNRRRIAACTALLAAGVTAVVAGCGPTHSISQDAAKPVADAASGSPVNRSAAPSASASEEAARSLSNRAALGEPATTGAPTATGTPTAAPPATGTPTAAPPATGTPAASIPAPRTAAPSSPTSAASAGRSLPVIGHTATGGRTVALTFDDGPGPYTGQILDVLAQFNVKATFCEIGQQAAADPAMVKRVVAAGHRLCDHTVDHPQPMHTESHDKQTTEIDAAKDMITKASGGTAGISWFRAPGGDFSAENKQIAAQDGMASLGWTVDTRDWSRPGTPAILAAVQQELRPGGVILMHDGGGDRSQSVAALKQLIPWLASQGYTFDFPAS